MKAIEKAHIPEILKKSYNILLKRGKMIKEILNKIGFEFRCYWERNK